MFRLNTVWKEALFLWARVFKRGWPWFFFAQSISVLTSLGVATLQKYAENYLILGIALLVLVQLNLIVFGVIIVNQIIDDVHCGRGSTRLGPSLKNNLKFVFINFSRTLLKVILGSIFFIIPGLVFWLQLTFVPYVVMFDPDFKAGKVDALKKSETLVRGRFWRVAGILILCMGLSMVSEFWLGSIKLFEKPVLFVMVFFFGMVLESYGDIIAYCLYRKLAERI